MLNYLYCFQYHMYIVFINMARYIFYNNYYLYRPDVKFKTFLSSENGNFKNSTNFDMILLKLSLLFCIK